MCIIIYFSKPFTLKYTALDRDLIALVNEDSQKVTLTSRSYFFSVQTHVFMLYNPLDQQVYSQHS
jgi:hypothetical protein